jgi:hypothetical protein
LGEPDTETENQVDFSIGFGPFGADEKALLETTLTDLQAQWQRQGLGEINLAPGTGKENPGARLTTLSIDPLRPQAILDAFVAEAGAEWRSKNHRLIFLERDITQARDAESFDASLEEAEKFVLGDRALGLPLFFLPRFFLKNPKLENVSFSAYGSLDLGKIAMEW